MPRVLVLNNYPLDVVCEEVKRGEKPNHHLYGINYFHKRGYEIEIIPFKSSPVLQKIDIFFKKCYFPIPLGDFDQQSLVMKLLKKADLIYAPCQAQTDLLSYLRALGIIKVPIVCLAHHPPVRGRLVWLRRPFL